MKAHPNETPIERLDRLQRQANLLRFIAHNLPGPVPAWVCARSERLARLRLLLSAREEKKKENTADA